MPGVPGAVIQWMLPHLRPLLPSCGRLFGLQKLVVSLLEHLLQVGVDVVLGRLVQVAQAAGAALLLRHAGSAAELLHLAAQVGAVDGPPAAGDEHRAGCRAVLGNIIQQFLAQRRRQMELQRAAAAVQHGAAVLHHLHGDLLQALQRQVSGGKQLDQQVQSVLVLAAGHLQQAQIFGTGQFRHRHSVRAAVVHQQVVPAAPAEVVVGCRDAHVDAALPVPLPVQVRLPGFQQLGRGQALAGQEMLQLVQGAAVTAACVPVPGRTVRPLSARFPAKPQNPDGEAASAA